MTRNLKRVLATAAMAPFAVLAIVAPAGASSTATVDPSSVTGGGTNTITALCEHPLADVVMELVITLEGTGADSDSNDVTKTVVTVTDNDGAGAFDNDDARAESVRIEYFDDDADGDDLDRDDRLYNEDKRLNGRHSSANVASFNRGKDNVGFVRAHAEWSRVGTGFTADPEDLTCTVPLPA